VHAIPAEGALIVETTHTNKASAAELVWKWFLASAEKGEDVLKPDFLLVVGDNREDEPVFRWANKLQKAKAVEYAMTVTLGSRSTEAKATLTQGVTGKF
jgi:trehalose 6-phosphate synthase/phosphatase